MEFEHEKSGPSVPTSELLSFVCSLFSFWREAAQSFAHCIAFKPRIRAVFCSIPNHLHTHHLPTILCNSPPTNLLFHVCRASRLTTTSTTSSIWIRAISHYFPLNILKPLPGDMLGTWDVLMLDFFLEKRGITSSKRKISFNLYFYLLASLIEGRNTFCKEPNWIQFHF